MSWYSLCYQMGLYYSAMSQLYYVSLIYKPFFSLINYIWQDIFESLFDV